MYGQIIVIICLFLSSSKIAYANPIAIDPSVFPPSNAVITAFILESLIFTALLSKYGFNKIRFLLCWIGITYLTYVVLILFMAVPLFIFGSWAYGSVLLILVIIFIVVGEVFVIIIEGEIILKMSVQKFFRNEKYLSAFITSGEMYKISAIANICSMLIGLFLSLMIQISDHSGHIDKAKQKFAKAYIEALSASSKAFYLDMGRYPKSLGELIHNNTGDAKWKGPYLEENKISSDPWGNPYKYRLINKNRFEIISYGADGLLGGDGFNKDISSSDDE